MEKVEILDENSSKINNKIPSLGYGVQLASVATPGVLTQNQWRTFWISWERNIISFGEGTTPHNRTLLKWRMDKKMKVQHVGFASSWGTTAEFR